MLFFECSALSVVLIIASSAIDQKVRISKLERHGGGVAYIADESDAYLDWNSTTLGRFAWKNAQPFFGEIEHVATGILTWDELLPLIQPFERLRFLDVLTFDTAPEHIRRLRRFKFLEHLGIATLEMEPHAFAQLRRLPAIKSLDLLAMPLSDDAVIDIGKCQSLERLVIWLEDDQVSLITSLQNLTTLDISDNARFDGSGLKHLKKIAKLRKLDVSGTNVDDTEIGFITDIANLEYLDLQGTTITDKAIQRLLSLMKLRQLDVRRTPITDKSLNYIARMRSLESVLLDNSNVSAKAVENLRNRRPGLAVGAIPFCGREVLAAGGRWCGW